MFRTFSNVVSPIFLAVVAACATPGASLEAADASLARSVVDGVQCVDLIAGRNILAGEVCAEVIDDALVVTYATTGGHLLDEVHLWVGDDLGQMPTNSRGIPVPGQFPYSASGIGADSFQFVIPLDTSAEICTETLFAAAHAALSSGETAWGAGQQFGGPRWGSTFEIELIDDEDGDSVCDPEDVCPGYDDLVDTDGDGVPNGCDICEGHDDAQDADQDGTPDGCELPEEPPVEEPPVDEWPSESGCETAFAFGDTELNDLPGFPNRWGWSIGPFAAPTSLQTEIWAAAGNNVLANGTHVGDLLVDYDGNEITVTWDLFPGSTLEVTHLYVGDTQVATSAPGNFGHTHDLSGATTDSFTIGGFAGEALYVVAHAEVCF